jgi:hypothetical protein
MNITNKSNNITTLLNNSYYKILNYKLDSLTLYNIIFEYCEKNKIIISNPNINLSIINNISYKLYDINNDFNFNLISINPYKDAINLSNIIYNIYSKYVVVSSYINNKEIILSIDNNRVIKFNLLFLYSSDIIDKIQVYNFNLNKYKLYYSSDLFELMLLTHKIYNPNEFIKYIKSNNNIESKYSIIGYDSNTLYTTLIENLFKNINNNKINEDKINNEIRYNINKYIIESINQDIYTNIKFILLDNIVNINTNLDYNKIINLIIFESGIKFITNLINKYLEDNNLNKLYKITIKYSNTHIVNDFRLTKTNIILHNKKTNKNTILIISYNSLNYEVIPIIHKINKILIPHPIVIIRYYIINLFNLQLFDSSYNKNSYYQILKKIQNMYNIEKEINDNIINKKIIVEYHGIFIDERIDKFKFGSNIYRPWQYKLKNNKLLKIN